jgi:cysteine desulfurase
MYATAIRPGETILVSVMGVNNEIGVIQPLKEIGKVGHDNITCEWRLNCVCCIAQICKANKVYFHSDVAQMIGKVPMDVHDLGIDIASISSHKVLDPSYLSLGPCSYIGLML